MITDGALAVLCARAYDSCAIWDRLWFTTDDGDVWCALTRCAGVRTLVFRGSKTFEDWFRNFCALPVHATIEHADLGEVHAGFYHGLPQLLTSVLSAVPPDEEIAITGHSLGGARALIFAGLLLSAGRRVAGVTAFGPPKPGMARLTQVLKSIDLGLYQNLGDRVCEVPLTLALLPYEHPRKLLPLNVAPRFGDRLGALAVHRIENYVQAFPRDPQAAQFVATTAAAFGTAAAAANGAGSSAA